MLFAFATIERYRTAISHVLKATQDLDIGKSLALSTLIANFAWDTCLRIHYLVGMYLWC